MPAAGEVDPLPQVPVAHCFGPRGLYKRKFCAVCRKGLEAPALRCEGTAAALTRPRALVSAARGGGGVFQGSPHRERGGAGSRGERLTLPAQGGTKDGPGPRRAAPGKGQGWGSGERP